MKKKLTSVFVMVSEEGIEGTKKTFNLAKELAEELWEYSDKPSEILEVVKRWSVDLPEEPLPDIREIDLGGE